MSAIYAPGTKIDTRVELVDHINTLLHFDTTGRDCDTAMALMRWNTVRSDELNARFLDPNRPIYRPITK
jgi:hypothetical protein